MKRRHSVWRRFFRKLPVLAALVCLFLVVVPVMLAPVLAPNSIYTQNLTNRFAPPSRAFPMGTDQLGRCLFSRLLYGGRVTLGCSLLAVVLTAAIGIFLGTLSGFTGGWFDSFLMRLCDVLYAFPSMVLTLAFVAVAGRGMKQLVYSMLLTGWVNFARISRTLTMEQKHHRYLAAARMSGSNTLQLLVRHVLPAVFPSLIALVTIQFGHIVLAISSMSFLGLGVMPPEPEWGAMINVGREFIYSHAMIMLWPGVMIFLVVVSLQILGDYLQTALQEERS